MRPLQLLVLTVLFVSPVYSQHLVKGRVVEQETGKGLPGVSVFLANTSIGTVAASDGSYELQLPQGRYDVVYSFVGYQSKLISSNDTAAMRLVKLQLKDKELEAVEVQLYEKDGWNKWGKFFTESFIGTTQFADDCRLQGTGSLRFRHDKKANRLVVIARQPLVIENKALGYRIRYELEAFVYDFKNQSLYFEGFPFFEEMKGGAARRSKWKRNRRQAYEGSQLHFMRAVYRNRLVEEGFELRRLKKIRNEEKDRVRSVLRQRLSRDSSKYYEHILSQPNEFDIINPARITGDSIGFAIDKVTAGVYFPDYLDIIYTRRDAPVKYYNLHPKARKGMASQVSLPGGEIAIQSNGSFYPPNNLLMLGYWGWSEKISTLLPLDYPE